MAHEAGDDFVVSNPAVTGETNESAFTHGGSSPTVLDVGIMDKLKKLHIGLVLALVLIVSLFLAVVALSIAFSLETSDTGSELAQVQQSLGFLADRLQSLNSSMNVLSQQLNGTSGMLLVSDPLVSDPLDNSSLNVQLLEDINSRTQLLNSSLVTLSQQLLQSISAIDGRMQQVNSSLNVLSLQLLQDISAIASSIQQVNASIQQVNTSLLQQVNSVLGQTQQIITDLVVLGQLETFPASSCAAILPSSPSGYYWVRASNGSSVNVYCDMTLTCGGVTGGWQRVVDLNFNNRSDPCPGGFVERLDMPTLRTCEPNDTSVGCVSSESFSTSGIAYSSVCGKLIGYQLGTPEAFARLTIITSLALSDQYLDGISLTHGNSMEHIWSFAAGVTVSRTDRFGCPCNTGSTVSVMSTFIGTDYFCDSVATAISSGTFYPNNPLWDGEGCTSNGAACCSFNSPPWFYKELPQSTFDDIEMRSCRDEGSTTEGTPFESIELYVHQ